MTTDVGHPVAEVVWRFPDDDGTAGSVAELSTYATLAAIESKRGRLLMLHAAGVADESGRVLAFIGPSGRGKTTLARTLGTGFGYVTDETVGIEADGTVQPYRKPLSVIRPGESFKDQLAPSELGLQDLPVADLRLGALVVVSREEDFARAPEITTMGLCEALAAIVPEASYLADMDRPLQAIAAHVDRCGAIQKITYGEAEQVLPLVPELLARTEPERWVAVLPMQDLAGLDTSAGSASYFPVPVIDAVEAGGQTAVLNNDRMVHVLDGVAPTIWRSVCQGFSFEALLERMDKLFGVPPGQELADAVVGVLEALAEAGVLVRVPVPVP
ncbi:hypothetical protein ACIPY2_14300 [Paenarthrobacter sp. NPDC089675]|uniref:ATP-binding cassette domain-containing protein n=1 Tax=Paenarthrobacter sp. NPDC089675 TaxID=3364376 RepID=UPI00380C8FB3